MHRDWTFVLINAMLFLLNSMLLLLYVAAGLQFMMILGIIPVIFTLATTVYCCYITLKPYEVK